MAINRKEFTEKIDTGLKANKSFEKFYLRFKTQSGKQYYKIFNYSDKHWNKKTRVSQAKADALAYKNKIKHTSLDAYVIDDV